MSSSGPPRTRVTNPPSPLNRYFWRGIQKSVATPRIASSIFEREGASSSSTRCIRAVPAEPPAVITSSRRI